MSKKKYYAVARGRRPGIYEEWGGAEGAEAQVKGYQDARFKGFPTREDAVAWFAEQTGDLPPGERPAPRREPPHAKALAAGAAVIYTDGASSGNPGPGGYGVVVLWGEERRELSGGYRVTTNNRMELLACIEGLRAAPAGRPIVLYSDSSYVIDGMLKGWVKAWRASGWLTTQKTPVKNRDLWQQLDQLASSREITWEWVRGHAGTAENERCDALAVQAAARRNLPADPGFEPSP